MCRSSHRVKAAVGRFRCLWMLLVLAAVALPSGCVRRRMTIRTNPPGARVYVDDYEIGTAPISHNFTYYGTRKIRLVKPGYETLTLMQSIPPSWYQIPPLDFVSENLIPGEIHDQRTLNYQLTPQMIVPTEQLLGRAEHLRREVRPAGVVGPLPAAAPPGIGPVQQGPEMIPRPSRVEPIPAPAGVGGQPVYPLPPSGR